MNIKKIMLASAGLGVALFGSIAISGSTPAAAADLGMSCYDARVLLDSPKATERDREMARGVLSRSACRPVVKAPPAPYTEQVMAPSSARFISKVALFGYGGLGYTKKNFGTDDSMNPSVDLGSNTHGTWTIGGGAQVYVFDSRFSAIGMYGYRGSLTDPDPRTIYFGGIQTDTNFRGWEGTIGAGFDVLPGVTIGAGYTFATYQADWSATYKFPMMAPQTFTGNSKTDYSGFSVLAKGDLSFWQNGSFNPGWFVKADFLKADCDCTVAGQPKPEITQVTAGITAQFNLLGGERTRY